MIKRFFFACLLFVGISIGGSVLAVERIESFETRMLIHESSRVMVEEVIIYDFGDGERHGIFRTIPVVYDTAEGDVRIEIDEINVLDAGGTAHPFSVKEKRRDIEIKIGDPDVLVTGLNHYTIQYRVNYALNHFESYDELYWNVTGHGWDVPIDFVRATVLFSKPQPRNSILNSCYAGPRGSVTPCELTVFTPGKNGMKGIVFSHDIFAPGEGLTIAAGFPKGSVEITNRPVYTLFTAGSLLGALLPAVLAFIYLFLRWFKYGKDPEGRGTIIAQYDAPDDLSPMEVGLLIDESTHADDLGAELIYLAQKGYVKIKQEVSGKILKKKTYSLERTKKKDTKDLHPFQVLLLDKLFKDSAVVWVDEMKGEFHQELKEVHDTLYAFQTQRGYFVKNPKKVRGMYAGFGAGVMVVGYILGWFGVPIPFALSVVSVGLVTLAFAFVMPKRTKKGVLAREHAFGLKLYLKVAEKDRIAFHNAPAKGSSEFLKWLPYAMVFGVEKQWAKIFRNITVKDPSWYQGVYPDGINTIAFARSLGSFHSAANKTLGSAPSGGSGSGGGGFSGGGFGGGGGGSW